MGCFTYRIPLKPIQWQRAYPNFNKRLMFDPQKAQKGAYAIYFESQCNHQPLRGILRMDNDYYFQVPPSRVKKAMAENWYWMTDVPDRTNLDKFVEDVCVAVRILSDDRYICDGRCRKLWTFQEPYTLVTFTELTHEMRD